MDTATDHGAGADPGTADRQQPWSRPAQPTRGRRPGRRLLLTLAAVAVLGPLAACGQGLSTGDGGAAGSDADWDVPAELEGGLGPLADRLADELAADYRSFGRDDIAALVPGGQEWWVTFSVEVPLDDADLDDPVAGLPPPFDAIGPQLVRLEISADTPDGNIGFRVDSSDPQLRSRLSTDLHAVTTVPGDPPPVTTEVDVSNVRITEVVVPVGAFDRSTAATALLAFAGPTRTVLSPGNTDPRVLLGEAMTGGPITAPPLTGTTLFTTTTTAG